MSTQKKQGPFLGVLMLDTAFPRVKGDAGNAESYSFPTRIRRIPEAHALDIVQVDGPSRALLPDFINAALELERQGAIGLVSTCGFLVHFQTEIAAAVRVPTMVSSLSLYPVLCTAFALRPIGILTASAESLRCGGLEAAHIDPEHVHIAGFESCPAFSNAILTDKSSQPAVLDTHAISDFAVAQAQTIVEADPMVACFLLECGNLPPYAAAIRAATGRPVFSILDTAQMFWSASKTKLL